MLTVYPLLFFILSSHSYKFTLDELYSMRVSVTLRAESYKDWISAVQDILENKGSKKRSKQ